MNSAAALPPFGRIDAALRLTTERLALEIAAPQEPVPAWRNFEWQMARAVASLQGISALLAARLRWLGPASWEEFLTSQRHLGRERHVHIGAVLQRLDDGLRETGIACIALKGSALRSLHLYAPGERPMGDIDLLARPPDAARVAQCLQSMGYTLTHRNARHAVFAPPRSEVATPLGEHPDNPLRIELHEAVFELLPVRCVDITSSLWSDELRPGLVPYRHPRELMRHLLLHAAGNMRAHALRLLQLHDIVVLARALNHEDWQRLLDTPESRGGAWWMWPVLELTARHFPGSLPEICAEFRARCPRLLRIAAARSTLTEVSWSNLRIAALPGLCWSRSPREAAAFVKSRLFPRREALDDLAAAVKSMPTLGIVRWYGDNHLHRVLRWIFSRPPRVQTLVGVRAALAEDPTTLLHP